MKKSIKQLFVTVVCAALLLAGCAGDRPGYSEDGGPESTAPDLFVVPSGSTQTDAVPEQNGTTGSGSLSFGPEKYAEDDAGRYLLYEGGEMHMEFGITATGKMATKGVGILFFVDGQIQPYKTANEDDYSYMHIFYPLDGKRVIEELIFVPVTGEEGDVLEMWYTGVYWPDYSYSENGMHGMVLTEGMPSSGLRLKYAATPSDMEPVDTTDRVISWSCNQVEVTEAEIRGWSNTDLQEKYEYHMYVNDSAGTYITGIDGKTSIRLRFEIWGNPYVHYGLVFFVDNQPVSLSAEDLMFFGVSSGKKTVVEAEVDMTGFDGESVVYAALIPRNWRSAEVLTYNWLDTTLPVYLYETSPFPKE